MIETIAKLQALLGERYAIERELGRGGTATVYLAHETKHERQVAVKVLRPDIGALLGVGRFLHEIKLTSRLQHPHILPLYDSGEADGIIYYVMPYVEGESLRGRMKREKRLPIPDVVRIAREVADALAYAHTRNIVHRDIKPENILLAGDHALVADFGIARAISRAGGENWEMVTSSGVVVGTPAYMSPEQAAGERELDGRTDLYSLGCVIYEMLAGEPPFIGPDGELRLARRFTERAPSVRLLRDAVPEHVDATISKVLERDPADRFTTAAELADALAGAPMGGPKRKVVTPTARKRAVLVGSGVAVAMVAATALWLATRPPATEDRVTPRVAAAADSVPAGRLTERDAPQPPPARDTTAQATPERRAVAAATADSLPRAVRAAALRARRSAAGAGATVADLAEGDASLASADALARSGRMGDAMVQVSSATTSWRDAERAARSRAAAAAVQQQMQARAPTVSLPASPPAAQPASVQPQPQPVAPAPAAVDHRPAIETVIADYARAIASRDLAAIRRVYAGLTPTQQQAWEQFFQSVRTVRANLSIAQLDLTGDSADASVIGSYSYVDRSGRTENRPASFRVLLRREGTTWRMITVR